MGMDLCLLARLYPTLAVRADSGARVATEVATNLARRINPKIDFAEDASVEIAIGDAAPAAVGCPRIFVGSSGWNAFVATSGVRIVGESANPFGAGAAACLAAANLFRCVFLAEVADLDKESTFSVLEAESHLSNESPRSENCSRYRRTQVHLTQTHLP
jgi:hypothetical protein